MDSKQKKKIIGILGGIGPEATGEFYLNLILELQKRGLIKSNIDFPQIVINSIPAPELIYEEIPKENLKPYINGLKELEKLDVDFIAMICNTIHFFCKELQNSIKTPIIDLKKELNKYLIKKNIKSIVVLGTPTTMKNGLYKFEGIKYLDLTKEEIKLLTQTIFNFNKGFAKNKQIQIVQKIANKYLNKGAEVVILGCTELALMLKEISIPKINPMDILSEVIIKKISVS